VAFGNVREAAERAARPSAAGPARPSAAGAAVRVERVSKSFGPVRALRGVSLSAAPGEFLTITGPSGSGKTTLLSLIGTLERPDEGLIEVDGAPVPDPREAVEFRRHVVGFVFQDNMLMPYLTARSNVETAMLAAGVGRHERRERALQLLADVGLSGRAEHVPAELSGGERQRAAIARALANHPRLLLADEPTGALDEVDSVRLFAVLDALRERYGTTLAIVSHDPSLGDRADRTIRLVDGVIANG
jgi:lipoprotein-releasing system ATP-binding protein